MKTLNDLGIITYKNYSENVIIDNNFDTQALYNIIDNDPDFVKFEIFKDGVLVSTTEPNALIPSEKVKIIIAGVNELNKNHKAGIRGGLVHLFFGDRFTKEEIKYIEANLEPETKRGNSWVAEGESEYSYTGLQG